MSAVQPGYKKFRFFEAEAKEAPLLPSHVTCSTTGGGSTWLGTGDGTVLCLASDLSLQGSFQAHHGVVHGLHWCQVRGADGAR